jgi:DNA-3-methyladenine glycosylase II
MPRGPRNVRYNHQDACRHLSASDARLKKLIEQVGPFTMRLKPTHSTFEALLESIIYQQLHGKAAKAIHTRVLALFSTGIATAEELDRLRDETLRGAGLSAGKLAAIRDLGEKSLSGIVPTLKALHRLPDDEICERLIAVRGIGVWTAQMLLIFRMGRPDVLPVSDYGVRKGFALTIGKLRPGMPVTLADLPSAAVIEKRAARWKPWCSVASWYLWRACDLARDAEAKLPRMKE